MCAELGRSGEEFVYPYGEGPAARDARVVAEEAVEPFGERRVARVPLQLRAELHRYGLRQIAVAEFRPRGLGIRGEPALHELPAGGRVVVAEGREVVPVRVGARRPVEGFQEGADRGAHDEPGGPGGQLLEEVRGDGVTRRGRGRGADRRRPLLLEHRDGRGEPEGVAGAGERDRAPGPGGALRLIGAVRPEELGRRADGGLVAQQPGVRVQAQQGGQDRGGVLVVDAPGVPLVVRHGGRLPYESRQFGIGERGEVSGPVLVEEPGGQVLGTVDGGVLGGEQLLPVRPGRRERRVGDRGPVVRPGQREGEALPLPVLASGGHERQVERLGVDGEPVPAQPDHGPAVRVQLGAVAQGAARLLAGRLQPSVQLLRPYGIAESAQFIGGAADLGDHRVGGEVGVDGVEVLQRGHPPGDGLQHPARRPGQPLRAPRPLVLEGLLARRERLVHLGAALGQLGEEVVELREPRLQVLQLEQQSGQLIVARLRGVGGGQRARDGLPEQRELGGELGPPLLRQQLPAARVERGAGAVRPAQHLGDPLQDRGAHGGVTDLQTGDHVRDGGQPLRHRGQPVGHGGGVPDGLQRPGVRDEPRDVLVVAVEGVVTGEERHGPLSGGRDVVLGPGGQLRDPLHVGVPHLADRRQVAVCPAEFGQPLDPGGRRPGCLAAHPAHQRGDAGGGLLQGFGGPPGQLLYGGELGQHLLRGGPQLPQRLVQRPQFGIGKPVVPVLGAGAVGGELPVHGGRRRHVPYPVGEGETVGDSAHQVGVAGPGERAGPGGAGGGVGVGDVRGLPALQRVHTRGPVRVVPEEDERSVVQQRVPAPGERGGDLLADQVVGEEQAPQAVAGAEDVEHVLAVGRADRAFEDRLGQLLGGVEGLRGAGGEVVAAGEDDPLVLRQPVARGPDAVEPPDGREQRVEDQVPPGVLLVRAHAQQHQRPDLRVRDVGVGQRLQRLVDGLLVDPVRGLGVVGDLDGEGAAECVDEEPAALADGDVRVPPGNVGVPPGDRPVEVVGGREDMVALALRVEERPRRPVRPQRPAQHPDVLGVLPGPEDGEEPAVDAAQPQQAGVAEVAVKGGELTPEVLTAEEGAGLPGDGAGGVVRQPGRGGAVRQPGRGGAVRLPGYGRVVLRSGAPEEEYVLDPGFPARARPPLEAEEQLPAHGDEIAGHGRPLGAHLLAGEEPQPGRPELLGPPHVEGLGPSHQLPGLRREPPPQHLVGAGVHIALPAPRRGDGAGDVAVHAYGSLRVPTSSSGPGLPGGPGCLAGPGVPRWFGLPCQAGLPSPSGTHLAVRRSPAAAHTLRPGVPQPVRRLRTEPWAWWPRLLACGAGLGSSPSGV